jgi:hypothetical protein
LLSYVVVSDLFFFAPQHKLLYSHLMSVCLLFFSRLLFNFFLLTSRLAYFLSLRCSLWLLRCFLFFSKQLWSRPSLRRKVNLFSLNLWASSSDSRNERSCLVFSLHHVCLRLLFFHVMRVEHEFFVHSSITAFFGSCILFGIF